VAGAPVDTFDIDIVHHRERSNVSRLLLALQELQATYRIRRDLSPNESHLASAGHQLLITRLGALDVRGEIGEYGKGLAYEDLLPHTEIAQVNELAVRVLELEYLIEVKEQAGRDKDKAVLPILRATLAEKKRLRGKPKARARTFRHLVKLREFCK
jgi:hypothetical protein